jgi:hypothetical protein
MTNTATHDYALASAAMRWLTSSATESGTGRKPNEQLSSTLTATMRWPKSMGEEKLNNARPAYKQAGHRMFML